MGKSKPRQRNKNRDNPTANPSKVPSDPELAAIRDQRIVPVLRDLQSADLKIRSTAASAITNIIEDQKCRKLLLKEQIVRILFEQTLTDSNLETRTAGWGILRNLALEEEADFSIHLYRRDILTAIEGVVKTIIQTIESGTFLSTVPKAQQDLVWTLAHSIIGLLTSLSEAQDDIVQAISKLPTLVNFLFGLLALDCTPDELQSEVLSCLIGLTEENKPLALLIVEKGDWLKGLMQMNGGESKSIPACGVLHNIFTTMQWYEHNTPVEGASDASLISNLIGPMVQRPAQGNSTNGQPVHSSPDHILQLALEITASIATSLQEAIEHGSRHEKEFEGFGDDDDTQDHGDELEANGDVSDAMEADGEDADEADDDDDHSMNSEEIEADMDMVTGDAPIEDEPAEDLTLDMLIRNAAPRILDLAGSSSENQDIRSHALSALNNIAWTISSIEFSSNRYLERLQSFWLSLAERTWKEVISPVLASNTADIELAASITSLGWAVARSVKGKIKIEPEEQRKFMALYHASKNLDESTQQNGPKTASEDQGDAFQGLGVKAIGVLGTLALDPAPVELNREIGVFLLTVLSSLPDTPAADAVEALNQIFDIYADKSYACDDSVFWADGFYKHLEGILPKAKKMSKSIDKRRYPELRTRADEAVLNLGRFLKYKRTERSEGN